MRGPAAHEDFRVEPPGNRRLYPEEETKKPAMGTPVHSFPTLLADLATLTHSTITPNLKGSPSWQQETEPTPIQRIAFELLDKLQAAQRRHLSKRKWPNTSKFRHR